MQRRVDYTVPRGPAGPRSVVSRLDVGKLRGAGGSGSWGGQGREREEACLLASYQRNRTRRRDESYTCVYIDKDSYMYRNWLMWLWGWQVWSLQGRLAGWKLGRSQCCLRRNFFFFWVTSDLLLRPVCDWRRPTQMIPFTWLQMLITSTKYLHSNT